MPELPEVETIRRQLVREVVSKEIAGATIRLAKMVKPSPAIVKRSVKGKRIIEVLRRAKLLIFNLSGGQSLVMHLKLTGQLLLKGSRDEPGPYTHVIFLLRGGRQLFFNDMRQFGYLQAMPTAGFEQFFQKQKIGPEPLGQLFTLASFRALLKRRPSAKIKPVLMDQSFLAGIGNVYAQEICFFAKVKPVRAVRSLTDQEIEKIYQGMQHILANAIEKRGSSVDTYVDLYGKQGTYAPSLQVYGRQGQKCRRCDGTIRQIQLVGRGTSFCASCQK